MPDRGPWTQTYSGRQFFYLDPRPEDISLVDIAAALSKLNRFTGHTMRFYSVAQHSIHVAENLREYGEEVVRHGLMHDAAEAYIGDIATPLKKLLGHTIRDLEASIADAIYEKYGLVGSDILIETLVRTADARMLVTERDQLLGGESAPWGIEADPYKMTITPMDHGRACYEFMRYATLLGIKD